MSEDLLEPDERRSAALLSQLAQMPDAMSDEFATGLVRRARAQRALASPIRAVGTLLAAIGGGIGIAALNQARRTRR